MNSIAVPELKPARDVPLYHDFRELLDGCAARFGSDIAFQIKTARETKTSPAQYRTRSFLELRADVDALGAALYRRGMESKRFAIIGKNRYEWILGYWAHLCGLGIAVPLDKDLPLEELAQSLTKAKADALYFDLAHMELVEKLKEDPAFDHLQYFCMDEAEGFVCTEQLLAEGYANEEALEAYKALPVDGNALAVILFTSGTSGLAKAVMLSQFNMTHNIWSVLSVEDLRHGDVNMAFLPYHHTFGSTGQTMMTAAGSHFVKAQNGMVNAFEVYADNVIASNASQLQIVLDEIAEEGHTSLLGDLNMDGYITIADVTALIRYVLSNDPTGIDTGAADCNNDNTISIGDVTALIDILLSNAVEGSMVPRADLNHDGEVSIADVTVLIDILLSKA